MDKLWDKKKTIQTHDELKTIQLMMPQTSRSPLFTGSLFVLASYLSVIAVSLDRFLACCFCGGLNMGVQGNSLIAFPEMRHDEWIMSAT